MTENKTANCLRMGVGPGGIGGRNCKRTTENFWGLWELIFGSVFSSSPADLAHNS